MKPIEEQGYVIVAVNSADRDYIDCARTLTKTLKYWNPAASVCLITDSPDSNDTNLFDHYRQITTESNPYANDWLVFHHTPFRQTVKLEADMIVASAVDHWWTLFEHRDVVISQGARDYYNQLATSRHYREILDNNNLPDVYNAITYWRVSQTAKQFFDIVRDVFVNWDSYKATLKCNPNEPATTDWAYAIASHVIGADKTTIPAFDEFSMIHMKQYINGTPTENWTDTLLYEMFPNQLRVNTYVQQYPFHYHKKNFAGRILEGMSNGKP